jgi:hypothetical protein
MIRNDTWNGRLLLIAGVLATLALVAGCGGQKGGDGTPADSLQGSDAGGGTSGGTSGGGEAGGSAGGSASATRTGTIAAGTELVASLQQSIATDKNKVGDRIALRTTEPLRLAGGVTIPVGSTINGEVTHIDPAGRIAGGAELTLRFHELVLTDGSSYPITCEPFRLTGKGDAKESALEIGGGAVAGGIVGGVLGGKKDIAKGAAVGAVIGTGVAVATKGDQIVLPVGQKMSVKVTAPVTVTMKPTAS